MLKSLRFITFAVLAAFALAAQAQAKTESWNYQSYDSTGQKSSIGYITVAEDNGEASFKMFAAYLNNCYKATLKATVERTSEAVIVHVPPRYAGCDDIRFVLKPDGTGGKRQVLNGDSWVDDGLDRVLTVKN